METKVEIKDNLKTETNENAYIIAITKAEGKTIHVKITEEELSDLIGDALDGSDYWIGRIRAVEKDKEETKKYKTWSECIVHNLRIMILDIETDEAYELSRTAFLEGIGKYILAFGKDLCTAEEESICMRKDKPEEIMKTDHVLDTGNIDANIADSMLQFGLFGELVYG